MLQDVIMNVFNQNIEVAGPITRIKQETEDTKDYLRCALYSSVKSEPPPLEIGNFARPITHYLSLSTGVKLYRKHMAHLNNIPSFSSSFNSDLSKTSVAKESNNYHCMSCNITFS
ncbi:hypothetical protein MFLAVUS_006924 [Mucor flavus]|uniref:Uncharacterized protein n=1 Tax=Mucor flavus TaxID=439312 RepID=A0ABP9Z2V8_9FUNG